ncbi:MAG TPA: hypothetical protein VHA78_05600 [Candidatus Peribacteraceae bacterium]|nr:hypothetical protein [Candidatus Peribacteraceae bacterium]
MQRPVLIAWASTILLSACTVQPPANVSGRIDTLVQTASGIVQDARNTAQNVQHRVQNVQKGIQDLSSGATLLQNSLKP